MCANTKIRSKIWEFAQFIVNNLHNQNFQYYNNDIDIDNNLALVNLAKFSLPSKMSITDIVKKIYKM